VVSHNVQGLASVLGFEIRLPSRYSPIEVLFILDDGLPITNVEWRTKS
jgi:hypothetical protein